MPFHHGHLLMACRGLWRKALESPKGKLPSEPSTLRTVSLFCFAWPCSKPGVIFPFPWAFHGLCMEVTGDPVTIALRLVMGLV